MEIESCRIFVKVVQLGSFSKAAELLKLPKSTVSRTISRLERETETKLLLRTTRSITLTSAGRLFYESCLGPIQTLEDARKSLQGQDSIIAGTVRLTAPEDLGTQIISPALGKLAKEHPQLNFDLSYTDQVVDLVKEGFDMAIRVGPLRPSRFKAKRLGDVILIPVAAPDYLKIKGTPKSPNDLKNHDCLTFNDYITKPQWKLKSEGKSIQAAIKVKVSSNQMSSLLSLALESAGIAFIPLFLAKPYINSGRLCRVLPDWKGESLPLYLVTPTGTSDSSRLKLIADELSEVITSGLKLNY